MECDGSMTKGKPAASKMDTPLPLQFIEGNTSF
jgi:hypothetical protein